MRFHRASGQTIHGTEIDLHNAFPLTSPAVFIGCTFTGEVCRKTPTCAEISVRDSKVYSDSFRSLCSLGDVTFVDCQVEIGHSACIPWDRNISFERCTFRPTRGNKIIRVNLVEFKEIPWLPSNIIGRFDASIKLVDCPDVNLSTHLSGKYLTVDNSTFRWNGSVQFTYIVFKNMEISTNVANRFSSPSRSFECCQVDISGSMDFRPTFRNCSFKGTLRCDVFGEFIGCKNLGVDTLNCFRECYVADSSVILGTLECDVRFTKCQMVGTWDPESTTEKISFSECQMKAYCWPTFNTQFLFIDRCIVLEPPPLGIYTDVLRVQDSNWITCGGKVREYKVTKCPDVDWKLVATDVEFVHCSLEIPPGLRMKHIWFHYCILPSDAMENLSTCSRVSLVDVKFETGRLPARAPKAIDFVQGTFYRDHIYAPGLSELNIPVYLVPLVGSLELDYLELQHKPGINVLHLENLPNAKIVRHNTDFSLHKYSESLQKILQYPGRVYIPDQILPLTEEVSALESFLMFQSIVYGPAAIIPVPWGPSEQEIQVFAEEIRASGKDLVPFRKRGSKLFFRYFGLPLKRIRIYGWCEEKPQFEYDQEQHFLGYIWMCRVRGLNRDVLKKVYDFL